MKLARFAFARGLAAAVLACVALAGAGAAHARSNVYWSVGIDAAPGVTLGVGNARPYYGPAPVYVAPPPVYYAPPTYYAPAPVVYVRPAPVYYGPSVYYAPVRGYRHHRHHRHHRR